MSKGLIVLGYPGIGKSSIAGWNNCIDLESSMFHKMELGDFWYKIYCQVAIDIADQGYTVLVSTHKEVIDYFKQALKRKVNSERVKVIIFAPPKTMKAEWVDRLNKRYHEIPIPKNERALRRAENNWAGDLNMLNDSGITMYSPESMDYDLKNYICDMQKKYLGVDRKENLNDSYR